MRVYEISGRVIWAGHVQLQLQREPKLEWSIKEQAEIRRGPALYVT